MYDVGMRKKRVKGSTASARMLKRRVMVILAQWEAAFDTRNFYSSDPTTQCMRQAVRGIRSQVEILRVR